MNQEMMNNIFESFGAIGVSFSTPGKPNITDVENVIKKIYYTGFYTGYNEAVNECRDHVSDISSRIQPRKSSLFYF